MNLVVMKCENSYSLGTPVKSEKKGTQKISVIQPDLGLVDAKL